MKNVIVVYGAGVHNEKTITWDFCKVFRSKKKAKAYYNKKYAKLLEMYTNEAINYYSINISEEEIR